MELNQIAMQFAWEGKLVDCAPYGNGHINTTYVVNTEIDGLAKRYIMQKINSNVFPRTKELMENVANVTRFVREKLVQAGKDADRETLTLVPTKDGQDYFIDSQGAFYRMYLFIENTIALQLAEDARVFEGAGKAFGNFVQLLGEFPAQNLHEVIVDFHNTQKRFDNFCKSLDIDYRDRSVGVKPEINFILERKAYCSKAVDMLARGELPLRVTHNDTKLNNVLMDDKSGEPVCVIDLDTIMPGSLLYDFGDGIRSGCNTGLEDEKDLKKVGFDIGLFDAFVRGFLSGMGESITPAEIENLAFGAILMTFECGMRFLTDYLSGDTYFKTHYAEHNLVRARTQFKMVWDMEACLDRMNAIVAKYAK